jgi:hypothetical protein
LRLLNGGGVRYLVVGGYAVMKYTEPYSTKDLDIWIEPLAENAARALDALRRFGAPAVGVTIADFLNPDLIYRIGVEPVRVDVMNAVSGLDFGEAWEHRSEAQFEDVTAPVLSIDDLIVAKQAAGRAKDRLQAGNCKRRKRSGRNSRRQSHRYGALWGGLPTRQADCQSASPRHASLRSRRRVDNRRGGLTIRPTDTGVFPPDCSVA